MIYEYSGNGLVIEACPTLETPVDCSLPGSCVLGILQGIFPSRDQTKVL